MLYRPGPLAELCLGQGDLEIKSDVQEGVSLERGFMETQDGDGEAVSSQGASHQEMMLPPGPFLGNMDGIALVQMLRGGLGMLCSCCRRCPCTEVGPSKQGLVLSVPTTKGTRGSLQRCLLHDVTVSSSHNFLYLPDPLHPWPWLPPSSISSSPVLASHPPSGITPLPALCCCESGFLLPFSYPFTAALLWDAVIKGTP